MKSYEVHRIKKSFKPDSTEDLRKETEELLNRKSGEGFRVVSVDFEVPYGTSYIYSFIVLER